MDPTISALFETAVSYLLTPRRIAVVTFIESMEQAQQSECRKALARLTATCRLFSEALATARGGVIDFVHFESLAERIFEEQEISLERLRGVMLPGSQKDLRDSFVEECYKELLERHGQILSIVKVITQVQMKNNEIITQENREIWFKQVMSELECLVPEIRGIQETECLQFVTTLLITSATFSRSLSGLRLNLDKVTSKAVLNYRALWT